MDDFEIERMRGQAQAKHDNNYKDVNQDASGFLKIIPGKTDHDIARELREEMIENSKACCAVMDKAVALGFQIATTFGIDQVTKKFKVVHLVVSKTFE